MYEKNCQRPIKRLIRKYHDIYWHINDNINLNKSLLCTSLWFNDTREFFATVNRRKASASFACFPTLFLSRFDKRVCRCCGFLNAHACRPAALCCLCSSSRVYAYMYHASTRRWGLVGRIGLRGRAARRLVGFSGLVSTSEKLTNRRAAFIEDAKAPQLNRVGRGSRLDRGRARAVAVRSAGFIMGKLSAGWHGHHYMELQNP